MLEIQNLKDAIAGVVRAFEEKQGLYYEYSIGDDPTGVLCFSNEYFFNLSDIFHDLDTSQDKGMITQWHDSTLYDKNDQENYINYQSYCMGLRHNK